MKSFESFFLFLSLGFLSPLVATASVVCPDQTGDGTQTVTCCLPEVSACESASQKIPKDVLARAEEVHRLFSQGKFEYGRVPNCHWNTYSFLTGSTQTLFPLSGSEILDLVDEGSLAPVSAAQSQAGDVVLFFLEGEQRVEASAPGKNWQYVPFRSFEHSAFLLDHDLLFQKENVGNGVFSVAGVEQTRAAYEKAFPAGPKRVRGAHMVLQFYRPQKLSCQGVTEKEDRFYLYRLQCQNGVPQTKERIFKDSGVVGSRLTYQSAKPFELRIFDGKGRFTQMFRYRILENGHVLETQYEVKDEKIGALKSREEKVNFDPASEDVQSESYVLKKWFYDDGTPKKLQFIATYDAKSPQKILRKDYRETFITFQYDPQWSSEKPVGFKEFSKATNKEITTYRIGEPFDPKASLKEAGFSEKEIQRRLEHQQNPNRFLIGIIDSGFDYNHPELAWKWWTNPDDPINGQDDDGDGFTDDVFGWDRERNSPLPSETTSSLSSTDLARPDSHGTHVAHIATRDLEGVALVGFAGDYTKKEYIQKISRFLSHHPVKVINMSFGFPQDIKNDFGVRDARTAYAQMFRDHPDTLFVIAGGNVPQNIDDPQNHQYPANLNGPNVIKVGSLDTDHIENALMNSYKISPWSSFGPQSVDILAPGKDISAARLGGGLVVHSGTSMAAPFMTHEIARLWMKHPRLSAPQIKEIFNETAHSMSPRPQIVSGGFVDFQAANRRATQLEASLTAQ